MMNLLKHADDHTTCMNILRNIEHNVVLISIEVYNDDEVLVNDTLTIAAEDWDKIVESLSVMETEDVDQKV